VAITGAKLLYEDGLVEHAGIMCEPTGDVGYVNRNLPADAEGYLQTLVRNVAFTVVSGACQMLRRDVFEQLGGYDQTMNAGYSDVDLCLRAREAGYEVVLVNDAVLMHMLYTDKAKFAETHERRQKQFEDCSRCALTHSWAYANGDPYLNKHLRKDSEYFRLEW
jgi:GT2 family glycosyltransferase